MGHTKLNCLLTIFSLSLIATLNEYLSEEQVRFLYFSAKLSFFTQKTKLSKMAEGVMNISILGNCSFLQMSLFS